MCGLKSVACRPYIRYAAVVIPPEYFGCAASFKPVQAAMPAVSNRLGATEALRAHWPEYLMEAAALGLFMVSACVFGVLLEDIAAPANRVLAGIAMGLTAVAIISSPWGQRSGAHMNPAVTLTFLSLGKIAPWDALFYAIAQFAGAGKVNDEDSSAGKVQHGWVPSAREAVALRWSGRFDPQSQYSTVTLRGAAVTD